MSFSRRMVMVGAAVLSTSFALAGDPVGTEARASEAAPQQQLVVSCSNHALTRNYCSSGFSLYSSASNMCTSLGRYIDLPVTYKNPCNGGGNFFRIEYKCCT